MKALKWLPTFGARVIVPGHGLLCGEDDVACQLDYIEVSWARTKDHISQGHTLEETIKDPGYPLYSELGYPRLQEWNIEVMYRQFKNNPHEKQPPFEGMLMNRQTAREYPPNLCYLY